MLVANALSLRAAADLQKIENDADRRDRTLQGVRQYVFVHVATRPCGPPRSDRFVIELKSAQATSGR
jgi:hypothetical protein